MFIKSVFNRSNEKTNCPEIGIKNDCIKKSAIFEIEMEQDIKLWNRFLKGDNEALGELYSDLFEPLVFISFYYLKNNETARDIVSNLFVSLLDTSVEVRNEKWKSVNKLQAYLATAVKNKSIDYLRSVKNQSEILQHARGNTSEVMSLFSDESLNQLSKEESKLFQLHLDGYKNEEIAEHFTISEKTVRNKLSLTRKKMAAYFKTILFFLV